MLKSCDEVEISFDVGTKALHIGHQHVGIESYSVPSFRGRNV